MKQRVGWRIAVLGAYGALKRLTATGVEHLKPDDHGPFVESEQCDTKSHDLSKWLLPRHIKYDRYEPVLRLVPTRRGIAGNGVVSQLEGTLNRTASHKAAREHGEGRMGLPASFVKLVRPDLRGGGPGDGPSLPADLGAT